MKCKIKKNDLVYVRAGKDKGARGRVLAVYPDQGRVLVEHVNMATKHKKARTTESQRGIIHQEAPIAIANVMCIDEKTDRPTRVKIRFDENGNKLRCSAAGNPIKMVRT